MVRWTSIAVALALMVGSVGDLSAKSVRVRILDADLTKLPFGQDTEAVMAWVENKVRSDFGPRLKGALDRGERAQVAKEIADKVEMARKSLTEFSGKPTGLENSVLGSEFVAGAGESMIQYRQGNIDHYMLFTDGKLWKYVRALKAKGEFAERLKALAKDFGTPNGVQTQRGKPVEATWEGDRVIMQIRNQRSIYGTDLLLVIDRKMKLLAEAKRKASATDTGPRVDPELKGILED